MVRTERDDVRGQEFAVLFGELDRGTHGQAVEALRDRRIEANASSPAAQVWLGEVALHLERYDEALEAIGAVAPDLDGRLGEPGEAGMLARRSWLIAAEVDHLRGKDHEAEARARAVAEAANRCEDRIAEMRARFDMGRASGGLGDRALALERLAGASRLAETLGNRFYQGLIAHSRAAFLADLGELTAAERRFKEAIHLLEASDDLRFRAKAQADYAGLLTSLGRFSEALAILGRAEVESALVGNKAWARAVRRAMGKALLGLERYDEAAEHLAALVDLERSAGDGLAELDALEMLAHAQLGCGRTEAAERAANEAALVAARCGSRRAELAARLLAGRAAARSGKPGASEVLRALVAEADESDDAVRRAEARVYLSEALIEENPVEAELVEAEAWALPALAASPELRAELDRVKRSRLAAPVRVAPDGTLVIDTRTGWPMLKQAREAVERYLLARSLDETEGNAAAAGRLIGETRYQMHYLKRVFDRGEGRPSRAKGPDEDGAIPGRKSTRPKRLVRRRGGGE